MSADSSRWVLYDAYVYLEFLILACTIYILAPVIFLFLFNIVKQSSPTTAATKAPVPLAIHTFIEVRSNMLHINEPVLTDKKRTTKSIRNCVYFPFFIDYLLNLPQYHHSISFQFAAVLFGDTDKQTVFQSK